MHPGSGLQTQAPTPIIPQLSTAPDGRPRIETKPRHPPNAYNASRSEELARALFRQIYDSSGDTSTEQVDQALKICKLARPRKLNKHQREERQQLYRIAIWMVVKQGRWMRSHIESVVAYVSTATQHEFSRLLKDVKGPPEEINISALEESPAFMDTLQAADCHSDVAGGAARSPSLLVSGDRRLRR